MDKLEDEVLAAAPERQGASSRRALACTLCEEALIVLVIGAPSIVLNRLLVGPTHIEGDDLLGE